MFYPSDFEIKRTKEQEIRERIQQAKVDRLILSLRPRGEVLISQPLHNLLHAVRHILVDWGDTWMRSVPKEKLAHEIERHHMSAANQP